MLDANAGVPSGLLQDQFTTVGDYSECISIEHYDNPSETSPTVQGQYCFLTFKQSNQTEANSPINSWYIHTRHINRRFPFAFGICVPKSCSKSELKSLFENSREFQSSLLQDVQIQYCQVQDKQMSFLDMLKRRNTLIAL